MARFQVVEQFVSINGEGTRAGQLAAFVRFKGCNLRCTFCDTQWANQPDTGYTPMTEQDIVDWILSTGVHNVTLTGGEPLLQPDIAVLLRALAQQPALSVEIETNGSVSLAPFRDISPGILFTMDYKLPDSDMEADMDTDNFSLLRENDTVKFVSGSRKDLNRTLEIIRTYRLTDVCHVYISPVFGAIDGDEIVEFMKEHTLNGVNLQLQLHKLIWDPNERGV